MGPKGPAPSVPMGVRARMTKADTGTDSEAGTQPKVIWGSQVKATSAPSEQTVESKASSDASTHPIAQIPQKKFSVADMLSMSGLRSSQPAAPKSTPATSVATGSSKPCTTNTEVKENCTAKVDVKAEMKADVKVDVTTLATWQGAG